MEEIEKQSDFNSLYGYYSRMNKVKEWCVLNGYCFEYHSSYSDKEVFYSVNKEEGSNCFENIEDFYNWCIEQDKKNIWHEFPKTWDDLPEEHKGRIVVASSEDGEVYERGIFSRGETFYTTQNNPVVVFIKKTKPQTSYTHSSGEKYALYTEYIKTCK